MRKAGIALLIFILGAAQASADVECVKTTCEGKGRTCVETLHVTYEACRKAANKKCNTVQFADKFNCLKAELTPCALTRNDRQAACLAEVQACYLSCGPWEEGRADYWCVLEFDTKATGTFCVADPGDTSLMDKCAKTVSGEGQMLGAMTCDPLRGVNP